MKCKHCFHWTEIGEECCECFHLVKHPPIYKNIKAIERVRELHKEVEVFYRGEIILGCEYCFKASKYFREIFEYPCETIKALDGDK